MFRVTQATAGGLYPEFNMPNSQLVVSVHLLGMNELEGVI